MNAILNKGSSFTWQSIMVGVNSLENSYVWRVGNRQNIDIWKVSNTINTVETQSLILNKQRISHWGGAPH